jgi:hypothetical protein
MAVTGNVTIALENIANGNDPLEIRCWLQDHVRNFSGIGLKYCLDIGHAVLNGADLYPRIDAVGKDPRDVPYSQQQWTRGHARAAR